MEDVLVFLNNLLEEDRKRQEALEQEGKDIDTALEAVVALLTKGEAYQKIQKSLIQSQKQEQETDLVLQQRQEELQLQQAQKPKQEQLWQEMTAIDLSLPDYDRLTELKKSLTDAEGQKIKAETDSSRLLKERQLLMAEIAALKDERRNLEDIGAEKEKLLRQKQEQETDLLLLKLQFFLPLLQ